MKYTDRKKKIWIFTEKNKRKRNIYIDDWYRLQGNFEYDE